MTLLVDDPRVAAADWPVRETLEAVWSPALKRLAQLADIEVTTQVCVCVFVCVCVCVLYSLSPG